MIDWDDSTRHDRLVFELIDPNDLGASRGWLDGVIRRDSSITYAYYTDTRSSCELAVRACNYLESSLVRVHHYVDAWGYHNELGTYFVEDDDLGVDHGVESGVLHLGSRLIAMRDDSWVRHYSIAAGQYAKDVLAAIFDEEGLAYRIAASVRDYRYADANVYEFGESVISTVFDICDKAGAWLGVDGHGTVLIDPYIVPSLRAPVHEYGPQNILGKIEVSHNANTMPSRVGVIHKESDDVEITAYADVPASSPAARSRRGRRITEIVDIADMSPATYERAGQIARERLANATSEDTEYRFEAMYWPGHEGDAVTLRIGGVGIPCMVKTLEVSLAPGLTTSVSLKGV